MIDFDERFGKCTSIKEVLENVGELYSTIKNSDERTAVCNAAEKHIKELNVPEKPQTTFDVAKSIREDESFKKMKAFNIEVTPYYIKFIGKEYSGDSDNYAETKDIEFLLSFPNVRGNVDDLDDRANKWFIWLCQNYAKKYPDCSFEVTVI